MPRGDGTGPTGMGSMSGRAAGFCAGYGVPGFENAAPGRGFGMGLRGRRSAGCGWRGRFGFSGAPASNRARFGYSAFDSDAEKQMLKNQVAVLQSELDVVQKRLKDIETGVVAR